MLNNKTTRTNLLTYLVVIVAFAVMQAMNSTGMLGSSMKGFLVPICVYISLAVSLNLLVGICGELSLGHAGFMGIGAFSGIIIAALLKDVVANDFLRLLLAMVCGGVFAGVVGSPTSSTTPMPTTIWRRWRRTMKRPPIRCPERSWRWTP